MNSSERLKKIMKPCYKNLFEKNENNREAVIMRDNFQIVLETLNEQLSL